MKITSDVPGIFRIQQWFLVIMLLALICVGCSHNSKGSAAVDLQTQADPAVHLAPSSAAVAEEPTTNAPTESQDLVSDEPFPDEPSSEEPDPEDPFSEEQAEGEESFDWLDEFEEGEAQVAPDVPDPLSGLNRVMFTINDTLYFVVLKPATMAYRELVPSPLRTGVYNFFQNLAGPVRFVNCLLQGKGEKAEAEFVRFTMNTTIGVLGFGNPAGKYPEYAISDEDMGQTLGAYGIGEGFYLVLPILGPTTLRDGLGLFGDRVLWPVNYVTDDFGTQLVIWGYNNVNTLSFRIGDYETLKEAAIDPYEAIRDAYIQNRKTKVAQ